MGKGTENRPKTPSLRFRQRTTGLAIPSITSSHEFRTSKAYVSQPRLGYSGSWQVEGGDGCET